MKKLIVPLVLLATSAIASDYINHNQVIDYKVKYLEAVEELNRLEKIEDELKDKTTTLEAKRNKISGLKEMVFSYKFIADYRVNPSYSYITNQYYKLLDSYRVKDYNYNYNKVYYDFIMRNYKYIVNYANENLNDTIEFDRDFNVVVNGEKLVK